MTRTSEATDKFGWLSGVTVAMWMGLPLIISLYSVSVVIETPVWASFSETKIGHREGVLSPYTDEHLARLSQCPISGLNENHANSSA